MACHIAIGVTAAVYSLAHAEEGHSRRLLLAYQGILLALSVFLTISSIMRGVDEYEGRFVLALLTVVGPWMLNTALCSLAFVALLRQPSLYQIVWPLLPCTHGECATHHARHSPSILTAILLAHPQSSAS